MNGLTYVSPNIGHDNLIDVCLTGLEKIDAIKKNTKANKNKLASEHYLREYDSIQELRGGK